MNEGQGAAPVVSVVVPVFNRRDVIVRAVQSLLAQDLGVPFEIVVVDDGSTDGSGEAARLSERVRVVTQPNRGSAAARLTGIEHARGALLAFLDSDDVARPGYLRVLHAAFDGHSDVVLTFGRMGDLGAPRAGTYDRVRAVADRAGIIGDPLLALIDIGTMTAGMNLMVRREVALASAGGRGHVQAATDYDFALRCALSGAFRFVDEETVLWDLRDDGISRRAKPYQAAWAMLAAIEAVELSSRSDRVLLQSLQHRVEGSWVWTTSALLRHGDTRLATRVARDGLRIGRLTAAAKSVYWLLRAAVRRR